MNNCSVFRSNLRIYSHVCGIKQSSISLLKPRILMCNIRNLSINKGTHKPNKFEKYLLVWMKKYPSVAEVPSFVSADMMEKTRNWARIKINIAMCILAAVVCVFMAYSGKQAAKRGESIQKMNLRWHEEQNAKKEA